jgi:hypothetical protein
MDQLIDNRCLVLNWVPILLHTDEDIEFATRKRTKVLKILNFTKPALDKNFRSIVFVFAFNECMHVLRSRTHKASDMIFTCIHFALF